MHRALWASIKRGDATKRVDGHIANVFGEMEELRSSYTVEEKMAEKELIHTIETFLRKLSDADRDIFIR